MPKYNDNQLRKVFTHLLPGQVVPGYRNNELEALYWRNGDDIDSIASNDIIRETEYLYLCREASKTLTDDQLFNYRMDVRTDDDWQRHATWLSKWKKLKL